MDFLLTADYSPVPSTASVRTKGQVWTPRWVADTMAVFLVPEVANGVLDPAVGPGALLAAMRDLSPRALEITAFEIDPDVVGNEHSEISFSASAIHDLRLASFLEDDSDFKVGAIIANPPYLRHHRITTEQKAANRSIVQRVLGIQIDARAGLHVYFLVKALGHLAPGGRLAFLLPADTFEGVFAKSLWEAIAAQFRIEAMLVFDPNMPAFPGVDTNAVIVYISNTEPRPEFLSMRWKGGDPAQLMSQVADAFSNEGVTAACLEVDRIDLQTALRRGLTRLGLPQALPGVPFTEFAQVVRGIATGSNEFFLFTRERIAEHELDEGDFVRTIARVRDVSSDLVTHEDLESLDSQGRPTFLLSLNADSVMTESLRRYLASGELDGTSQATLLATRKKWYFMEKRKPVPILFAYLGRRNQRFIKVEPEIQPLTGFLCVYPNDGVNTDSLLAALNHPLTIQQLATVGKSYGGGALKVEPGGLRQLIIPDEAIAAANLVLPSSKLF